MRILFFLSISSTLLATINEPLRWKLLTGYRNDHIHSHEEEFRNIQFWENDLAFKVIHRDLSFYVQGGGSVFGRGEDTSHGWALDGTGYFGYAVNLTAERLYLVALTPLVGFSGHFEKLQNWRQTWYGPYIGVSIYADPGKALSFEVGYGYHWLHLRLHTETIKVKDSDNHGHNGWAGLEWCVHRRWRLGALGTIEYFFSNANLKLRFT